MGESGAHRGDLDLSTEEDPPDSPGRQRHPGGHRLLRAGLPGPVPRARVAGEHREPGHRGVRGALARDRGGRQLPALGAPRLHLRARRPAGHPARAGGLRRGSTCGTPPPWCPRSATWPCPRPPTTGPWAGWRAGPPAPSSTTFAPGTPHLPSFPPTRESIPGALDSRLRGSDGGFRLGGPGPVVGGVPRGRPQEAPLRVGVGWNHPTRRPGAGRDPGDERGAAPVVPSTVVRRPPNPHVIGSVPGRPAAPHVIGSVPCRPPTPHVIGSGPGRPAAAHVIGSGPSRPPHPACHWKRTKPPRRSACHWKRAKPPPPPRKSCRAFPRMSFRAQRGISGALQQECHATGPRGTVLAGMDGFLPPLHSVRNDGRGDRATE